MSAEWRAKNETRRKPIYLLITLVVLIKRPCDITQRPEAWQAITRMVSIDFH